MALSANKQYLDFEGLKVLVAQIKAADATVLGSAKDYAKGYTDNKVDEINGAAATLAGRVAANEAAIGVLNGDAATAGSVKKQVADAIAGVIANAPEDFDTLKEVADWIANDTTGAAKMQADIAKLMGADTVEGSVAKALKDAKAYTDEAIQGLDAEITSTDGTHVTVKVTEVDGEITAVNVTENDIASADDLTALSNKVGEIPADAVATTVVAYAKEVADAAQAEADGRLNTVEATVAKLDGEATVAGSVKKQIKDAVEVLDATVGEAAVAEGKHVAVQVVETDGKLTSLTVKESDIASADALASEAAELDKLQAVVGYSELAAEGANAKSVAARLVEIEALTPASKADIEALFNPQA